MKVHEMIRKLRRERGMTQEQLAEAMGVSTASVSKWETGQTAPELTALMALADFFEVSVDTMLGHSVEGNRRSALLEEMKALDKADQNDEARALAEELLRCYPNDVQVIEEAAHVHYDCYTRVGDRAHMEQAISLTKRLLTLAEDPSGMKKFELYNTLGNQYELMRDWSTAREYYKKGAVGKLSDRPLARLLANEGKHQEAVDAISKVFYFTLFEMLTDALQLAVTWKELGQPEKAVAALDWAIIATERSGENTRKELASLYALLQKIREEMNVTAAEEFLTGVECTVIARESEDESSYIRISV